MADEREEELKDESNKEMRQSGTTIERDAEGAEVGIRRVGPAGIALLSVYLVLITVFLGFSLTRFWIIPNEVSKSTQLTIHYLGWTVNDLSYETVMLVVVILCGALGSMVHALRSISWYVGNRELRRSWIAKYLMQPFVGATIALIFYFVIRAGFFSANQATVQNASLIGFAAMSGLVGLFSDQAVLKLKEVAETLLTRPKSGANALPQDQAGEGSTEKSKENN